MDIQTFSFSDKELWYLFSRFYPGTVIGLKDPSRGWTIDTVNKIESEVTNILLEDQILLLKNRQLILSQNISNLLCLIARAESAVSVLSRLENGISISTFFCKEKRFTKMTHEVESNEYTIESVTNSAVLDHILDLVGESNFKNDKYNINIEKKDALEIFNFTESESNSLNINHIAKKCLPLVLSLKKSHLTLSIIAFSVDNENHIYKTNGFALLIDPLSYIWLFEQSYLNQNSFEVSSISTILLKQNLDHVIPWETIQ